MGQSILRSILGAYLPIQETQPRSETRSFDSEINHGDATFSCSSTHRRRGCLLRITAGLQFQYPSPTATNLPASEPPLSRNLSSSTRCPSPRRLL